MPLALPARLTMDDARGALATLAAAAAADGGAELVVDASALARFDTSAVALLLELSRNARARGRAIRITGAPANLRALVALYGVDGLLPLQAA